MPAQKKHTQFVFDDLEKRNSFEPVGSYGYLSLLYAVLKDLTDIRNQKRLTQHDLAEKSGIAQPNIARIEAGRTTPSLMQIIKIAHALDHKITFTATEFPPGDYEGYLE